MQRMTDILSRMLHAPHRGASGRRSGSSDGDRNAGGGDQQRVEDSGGHLASVGEIVPGIEGSNDDSAVSRETSSAPASIASPAETSFNQPRLSDPSILQSFDNNQDNLEPMSLSGSPDTEELMPEDESQGFVIDETGQESLAISGLQQEE